MLLAVIAAALQLSAVARGALFDDCPVDRDQRIDNEQVIDVLETFYKDLVFVQASTEARQERDYIRLSQEIHNTHGPESLPWISDNVYQFFYWILYLLRQNRLGDAESELVTLRSYGFVAEGKETSYLYFLEAETSRLSDANAEASNSILSAYLERAEAPGVTLNELERLDGLIALQKVSQFNQNVDKYFGVGRSPDYHLLPLLHLVLGSEMSPLNEVRYMAFNKFYETRPVIGPPGDARAPPAAAHDGDGDDHDDIAIPPTMERVDPAMDNFGGQSVAHAAAKAILCEFAQKLAILQISSREDRPADYGGVIEELRRLHPDFAARLNASVVSYLDTDLRRARMNIRGMWAHELRLSRYDKVRQLFTRYFSAEVHRRRMGDSCNLHDLNDLLSEVMGTIYIRRMYRGVSMARLNELEGRVVFIWLKCFHERLKLAYGLDADDDEQQLEAKRAQHGRVRTRIIPDSMMLRRYPMEAMQGQ